MQTVVRTFSAMDTRHGFPCWLAAALGLVGDRWALLAVHEAMFGNHRVSQIALQYGSPRDPPGARLKPLVCPALTPTPPLLSPRPATPAHHGTPPPSPPP